MEKKSFLRPRCPISEVLVYRSEIDADELRRTGYTTATCAAGGTIIFGTYRDFRNITHITLYCMSCELRTSIP